MAKGKSGRGSAHGTPSSLTSLLSPTQYTSQAIVTGIPAPDAFPIIEPWGVESDARYHNPTKRSSRPSSLISAATRLEAGNTHVVGFAQPPRVALCVRRNARKEVLHARKLTKKGAGAKHRRRNEWSKIKC